MPIETHLASSFSVSVEEINFGSFVEDCFQQNQ
jgi:hypothetical protein